MSDTDSSLKQCSKCKEWKGRGQNFHKDKSRKDGLSSVCKKCAITASREWYRNNTEHAKETRRRYTEEHPDYAKNYRQEHPDQRRLWYHRSEENRKKSNAITLKWTKEHPKENAARVRNWRKKNLEKYQEIINKWRRNNLDKVRERDRERYRKTYEKKAEYYKERDRRRRALKNGSTIVDFTNNEWQEILEFYGNVCLCCGISGDKTPEGKLTQDHIIPLSKGGTHSKDNIQPLCLSCNKRKNVKIIDYR